MTDQPDQQPHNETDADLAPAPGTDPPPRTSRWERIRPRSRLSQIAAVLVAAAAGVFIVASIFVTGLAVGLEVGDHHEYGGEGSRDSAEMEHHGERGSGESGRADSGPDESQSDGSGHDGSGGDRSEQHGDGHDDGHR
jgi:hypothetical protein